MNSVRIVTKACIGCATCAILAPAIFALRKERKSQVVRQPDSGSDQRALADAINGCPVNAICVGGRC